MGIILWHRRETRRPTENTNLALYPQKAPAYSTRSAIDYEHYVQKQVRAVAEPVLALLGLDFNRVIGDDAQLRLF